MRKFQNKYRIESARLKHWDYANPGLYFVTICSKNIVSWFGDIRNDKMQLVEIGKIVQEIWCKIPSHFENVELDEFIIMPNHIHGIIEIKYNTRRDAINRVSTSVTDKNKTINRVSTTGGITGKNNPMISKNSLSKIIRCYKGRCTYEIHKFNPKFAWQPRFYDHVIRNELSLEKIQNYIQQNPINWKKDQNIQDEDKQFFKNSIKGK
ncbi:MAG: hypothetical protein HOM78_11075 [Candidatus Marinimicrobia bacterium]|jgi:REP element-mobilizing transposase RayT|nr:hypothetical protein [Candidatus Neomarinimicrobiota bacterium]MBT4282414.1 hypothetical protein [Candidatus Neomarinimicrobiota bacterium]MBT4580074.1 hypothetical protein [Candidatus Neomarinimicrobiota bacterium]MBT4958325.1 hypothetical protein [Candidatus Neomarinimicrobiota bacterium]MBT5364506.1 hypothetical protein [Candidatus Neomarinimicrobiota bacterium]